MKPIPIHAARHIAEYYGYDQVVIIAREIGDKGGEHCTTYGRDKANCDVAARIGDFLKFKVMGWIKEPAAETSADCAHTLLLTIAEKSPASIGHVLYCNECGALCVDGSWTLCAAHERSCTCARKRSGEQSNGSADST